MVNFTALIKRWWAHTHKNCIKLTLIAATFWLEQGCDSRLGSIVQRMLAWWYDAQAFPAVLRDNHHMFVWFRRISYLLFDFHEEKGRHNQTSQDGGIRQGKTVSHVQGQSNCPCDDRHCLLRIGGLPAKA